MVVRLIAMSAIFVDLQDESGCISRKRCQERLTVLFNNEKDLSPDEVDSIAEYCYTSVVTNTVHEYQGFHHAVNKVIEGMQRGDKTGKYSDACSAKGIDSATFSAACGSLEKIASVRWSTCLIGKESMGAWSGSSCPRTCMCPCTVIGNMSSR